MITKADIKKKALMMMMMPLAVIYSSPMGGGRSRSVPMDDAQKMGAVVTHKRL